MQTMPKHIFWSTIESSSLYTTNYTPSMCCYTPNRWAWSLPVTWQRWRSNHSIRRCRKLPAIRKLYGYLSFIEPQLLPIEVLHCVNREFRVFLRTIVENIKIFRSYRTSHADDAEDIFWFIIDSSSLYATRVTRGQGVLRRISGCGHFRSRDRCGGHTIWSAVADKPCYTQTLRLCLLQNRSYCRLIFLHCGNKEFRVFLRKIMENIIFPICVAKLKQMMPKHIFWPSVRIVKK